MVQCDLLYTFSYMYVILSRLVLLSPYVENWITCFCSQLVNCSKYSKIRQPLFHLRRCNDCVPQGRYRNPMWFTLCDCRLGTRVDSPSLTYWPRRESEVVARSSVIYFVRYTSQTALRLSRPAHATSSAGRVEACRRPMLPLAYWRADKAQRNTRFKRLAKSDHAQRKRWRSQSQRRSSKEEQFL